VAGSPLVAMDCEMVGTGPGGRTSSLARCSIVTYEGDIVYDRYVRPEAPIVDYRTRWSGIRRHHMDKAVPFRKAQQEVRGWGCAAQGWGPVGREWGSGREGCAGQG
uniref:Exonuclease domain-containing protein n=1 Tax=Malurus cyaneus samueli TaxID=2593467 RepID=A0A8C5TL59_9PASS